jgi:hypothetical protein
MILICARSVGFERYEDNTCGRGLGEFKFIDGFIEGFNGCSEDFNAFPKLPPGSYDVVSHKFGTDCSSH